MEPETLPETPAPDLDPWAPTPEGQVIANTPAPDTEPGVTDSTPDASPETADPVIADPEDTVTFVSTQREPNEFAVMDIRSYALNDGRIAWTMSPEDAERFERHYFVVTGRIERA